MLIWQFCISAAVPSPSSSKSSSNCVPLLSAYQAELFRDLGHLLDKGTPTVWVEIFIVTDLILWTSMGDKKINKNATTTATARHRVKDVYKKNLKVEVSLSPETSPRSISCQRCMCSQSMGVNNCCQGLQTTVCNKTTHFQWRGFSCYRGSHKGFREQNLLSL